MKRILISENEKINILQQHKNLILEQKSYHVRDIQTFLNQNGFSLVVDGTLGDDTLKAYNSFLSKKPQEQKYKAPDKITQSNKDDY
jgi:hypothetical protein